MNKFMKEAISQAKKAYDKKEVPVGCVIVKDEKIIARAYNYMETKKSSLCHAEILAIKKASKKLLSWRLNECDMYVTLEPCIMCLGAIKNSRIRKIYIATKRCKIDDDEKRLYEIINKNLDIEYIKEYEMESKEILKKFFKELRIEKSIK